MIKNTLKTFIIPSDGGGITQRKMVSTEIYRSQTTKLLNKGEDNEEKTKI